MTLQAYDTLLRFADSRSRPNRQSQNTRHGLSHDPYSHDLTYTTSDAAVSPLLPGR